MNIEDVFSENRFLREQCAKLKTENQELRSKNARLVGELISARDLAYTRMVQSFLGQPATAGTDPLPEK